MESRLIRSGMALLAVAALAFAGCQSKPAVKADGSSVASADPSTIQAEARGLAPAGDEHFKTINLDLLFGNPESVKTWKVQVESQKKALRSFSGSGSDLPESLAWDGKDDLGAMAPEGSYSAKLAVDYGTAFASAETSSIPFVLDLTPPSGAFSPNPALFGYAPIGVKGPVSITISAKPALASISAWSLDIFDTEGLQVKSLGGAWPSAAAVVWDGSTDQGEALVSGESYPAMLTIKDEFGNSGKFQGAFSVAAMPSAQPSAIAARRGGFSPTSSSIKNTIDLLTTYGSRESVQGWKVNVMSVTKGLIRSFSGDGTNLPEYTRWDGKDDSGAYASDGSYYSTLAVDYGKTYRSSNSRSASISLVTTPPVGSVIVDPPRVALAQIGPRNPVNLIVEAKAPFAQIASWTMSVLDSSGATLALFHSNWPNNRAVWDGKPIGGGALTPGATYAVVAKVQDEYGNIGELKGSLAADDLLAPTEPSAITALSPGFAPNGDESLVAINFKLEVGDLSSVSAWRMSIVGLDGLVQRTFSGTGAKVPSSQTWDGKKDDGSMAAEGVYTARLAVAYGLVYAPAEVSSASFALDLTPPAVAINLSTELFSPGGEGGSPTVTISLEAKSPIANIAGWAISVLDPVGISFAHFKGDWNSRSVDWDGKSSSGELVESASDYMIVARARDEFGNVGEARIKLPIDILVRKTDDGYRIRISSIVFKGFTADYKDLPPDRAARNAATLDLLAEKLALFPDYSIKLQGYAVMINWGHKAAGDIEQRDVLIPLSKARAEAIKAALSDRGIDTARMSTDGFGARDPIVPDSDYLNRWKNRRVEFFIAK